MNGPPIYISPEAILTSTAPMEAVGIALIVLSLVWWPTQTPFEWDEKRLLVKLRSQLPGCDYTLDQLARNRSEAQSFFCRLDDGRWVPSPEYFSLTNTDPGRAS
jgi:hypothetical protein